jgi:hypothetical protein
MPVLPSVGMSDAAAAESLKMCGISLEYRLCALDYFISPGLSGRSGLDNQEE